LFQKWRSPRATPLMSGGGAANAWRPMPTAVVAARRTAFGAGTHDDVVARSALA
jgi:hypothetical protein